MQNKNQIMSSENNLRVAIFGSCVSRDIFSIVDDCRDLVLAGYYARCSLASLAANPWVDAAVLQSIESPFQRKMVRADMDKSFIRFLGDAKFDVLLFDFIDERFNLQRMKNGALVTLSNEYLSAASRPPEFRS